MGERVPFDPEAVREIMSQGMTDEEYRNAQEPIEEVFDEQGDCMCGCCGLLLKASLLGAGGVEEHVKWHDSINSKIVGKANTNRRLYLHGCTKKKAQ